MLPYQEPSKKLKVGIVGCGVIGSLLARACKKDLSKSVKLVALYDINKIKARILRDRLDMNVSILPLKELIKKSELVIEAASSKVSGDIAEKTISAGKDVMVMSVGGLLHRKEKLFQKADKKGCRIYLPSGAICGLDGIKAANIGKIESATLITRKPPKGLEGAPYIKQKRINLKSIRKDMLIFEGPASRAVGAFPKNINVSAALSIAGIGPKRTNVKIIVSPKCKRNIHEIELKGDFGRIYTKCENVPSKENLKTSMLAALSAIATLKGIVEPVRIGT